MVLMAASYSLVQYVGGKQGILAGALMSFASGLLCAHLDDLPFKRERDALLTAIASEEMDNKSIEGGRLEGPIP
jgi:hypothetical protein